MAKSIGQVATTQTFQNWLTKTNDLVDILATNVITADTGSADTTTGDANLAGTFSATNLTASTLLSADTIGPVTGGGNIAFNGTVQVNGPNQVTTIFSNAAGGQTRYTNGSLSWDVGLENGNPGNFIINTGVAPNKFELSTAGTLTVPNMVVTGQITANTIALGSGGSGLSSDDIDEGTENLYFTEARAIASFTGGDGINIATDGTISFDGEGELNTYQGNEFIVTGSVGSGIKSYIDGGQNVGVPYGQLSAEWGGNTWNTLTWFPAGVSVTGYVYATDNIQTNGGDIVVKTGSTIKAFMDQDGNGYFTGDVTSNGSASDERLKENIVPLEKGLAEVEQIKTYTFNYKDRPEDTLPGVIAQEIEQILPEVVYDIEMEDDTYKAVRYQQIVPVLIEAIKDLSDKVKDLENRLENNG
jgi:hypothetical protein